MSDKYRSNFPMAVALDQLIVQFLEFVTSTSETVTITDVNGNPVNITSLGSAAGTGVPASAVVAISNKADDAFSAANAASGIAANASSDAASAISITTGYQSAIDSAVAASNSATGAAQQAHTDALGASGYADTAHTLAQQAESDARGASGYAGQAYALAQQAESDAQGASAYAGVAHSLAASAMSMASSGSGGSASAKLPIQPIDGQVFAEYPSGAYLGSTSDGTAIETGSLSATGSVTAGSLSVSSATMLASGAGSVVAPSSVSVYGETSSGTASNYDHLEFAVYRNAIGGDWSTASWRIQRRVDSTVESWLQLGYGYSNDRSGGAIGFGSNTLIAWDSTGNTNIAGNVVVNAPGSVIGSATSNQSALSLQSSGSPNTLNIIDRGVNGANLLLQGNGATAPNKTIRAQNGSLQFVNHAYSSILSQMDDNGNWSTIGNFTAAKFYVGTTGPYFYVSDGSGSVTLAAGLSGSSKSFTFNADGDFQVINGNITVAQSITMNGKTFTVDGAGNLAFGVTTLYNASGVSFSLSTNGKYWNFNADGTFSIPNSTNIAGDLTITGGFGNGYMKNFSVNQASGPLVYESDATNHSLGVRTGPSTAYKYFSFGYDGSFNVPNGLLNVAGELQTTSPNAVRMVNGNYGVFWRQDGVSLYLMKTASGSQYGTWDASRPFVWTLAGGISSDQVWTFSGAVNANGGLYTTNVVQSTWSLATGTIANGGGGGNYGLVAHANNNGGSTATSCAAITFIRDGVYGCYFGIDTDNVLKIGGWSAGNVAYRIFHEGLSNPAIKGNPTLANGNGLAWASGYSAIVGTGGATLSFSAPSGSTEIVAFQLTGTTESFIGSDGTYQVSGSGGIRVGYNSGSTNSVDTSGWFRSSGQTGWYNASYGIGIYAIDGTYVRTYNNAQMAAADFVVTSDRRLKTRIRDFEYRGRLRPVNYFHLVNGAEEFGFISQEVQELYPEIVGANPNDGMLNLSYEKITAILSAQLNRTEDNLAALRKEFDNYRAERENTLWKRLVKRVAKFFNIK